MRFLTFFLNFTLCFAVKNFMGANLDIICSPSQIKPEESFAIQVKYKTDIPREVDIHFDVINEKTKKWITGTMVESDYQTGSLSLNVTVPKDIKKEFVIWKVFVTSRGEMFPNMLAEKGLAIDIGNSVIHSCSSLFLKGKNITKSSSNVDFVLLETKDLKCGKNIIIFQSQVHSQKHAYLTFNLMDIDTNMLIYSAPEKIQINSSVIHLKGSYINDIYNMTVNIPKIKEKNVYSIAMLSPDGTWDNRLSDDRHYNIQTCT